MLGWIQFRVQDVLTSEISDTLAQATEMTTIIKEGYPSFLLKSQISDIKLVIIITI